MSSADFDDSYLEAIRRAFQVARELDSECGPVHFLVGISESPGPAAAALDPGDGRSLRAVVAAAGGRLSVGAGYLHMQAQGAAKLLADARGERPGAEHLLIALLDQAAPEVLEALRQAGVEPAAARRAALAAIGAAADQPPITLPALIPAGTGDRPALPVTALDARAWAALRWRQAHLPLGQLRRRSDWDALSHLETAAAWRIAERIGLDDDQLYSLISHHAEQVKQRGARARPDLVGRRRGPGGFSGAAGRSRPTVISFWRPGRRKPGFLRVTVGWEVWFRNRQVGLRNRWFRLRTLRYYRGAPRV